MKYRLILAFIATLGFLYSNTALAQVLAQNAPPIIDINPSKPPTLPRGQDSGSSAPKYDQGFGGADQGVQQTIPERGQIVDQGGSLKFYDPGGDDMIQSGQGIQPNMPPGPPAPPGQAGQYGPPGYGR